MLPNVFILGAARCGTNWLCELLRQVPDVCVPILKEPNFFDRVDEEGWEPCGPFSRARRERILHTHSIATAEAYSRIYDARPDASIRVDGSVRYLWSSRAPERLAKMIPDARMIVLVRNPTERAWSHYLLNRMLGTERLGFIDALDREPQRIEEGWGFDWRYREVSDYASCLNRWYEHVPPAQFLIREYEQFIAEPACVLEDVLEHIGVRSPGPLAKELIEANRDQPKIHPRQTTHMPGVAGLLWDPAIRTSAKRFVPTFIRSRIAKGMRSLSGSSRRPELDVHTRTEADTRLGDLAQPQAH